MTMPAPLEKLKTHTTMIKNLLPSFALLSVILMYGCSSGRLAQQNQNDDVYYSAARAKVVPEAEPQASEYQAETEEYQEPEGEYYEEEYASDDYAARIRRFYRYSPWRGYYDYSDPFDPFYYSYSRFPYYRPGLSLSFYIGRPYYDPFSYGFGYGYLGSPYYRYGYGYYGYGYNPWGYNRWGLYSYYNSYPGYYGAGRTFYASPNYRPRPSRDFDNIYGSPSRPGGRASVRPDGRVTDTRTRAERYGDGRGSGTSGDVRSTRPAPTSTARPTRTEAARPSRSSGTPAKSSSPSRGESSSRPTRTERYTPPPSPAPTSQRSSSESSSSSGSSRSSSGSSSGRPSRGN